jgi:cell division protein FtsW
MKLATTTLIFCVTALLSLGMVMLYSSSMADPKTHYLQMQFIWCSAGLVGCGVAAAMDYRVLKKLAWPLFALAVVLLIAVLIPHIGHRVNGARRWFQLGGSKMLVQPSELGKVALIIVLAWYGERYQRQMTSWKKGIAIPCAFIGLMLGLIFVEPDRGTTLLMAGVTGMMLLVAGVRWKFAVPPVIAGLVGLGISLLHDPMRTKRIFAWLYLEDYKTGIGYQAYQARLALGAGGWTGLGLGNSREKLGFLPEHNTDFIFSIIGEELGVVATLLVVLAFVVLMICGIYIAYRASDSFGLLLGAGVTFLIGLQAFINIGVVTSALPNKGLPLPFISYGGSNLVVMLTAVGLLLSISRRARVSSAAAESVLEPQGMPSPQAL